MVQDVHIMTFWRIQETVIENIREGAVSVLLILQWFFICSLVVNYYCTLKILFLSAIMALVAIVSLVMK